MAMRPPIITPGRETSSDTAPPRLNVGVNTRDGNGIIEAMDLRAARTHLLGSLRNLRFSVQPVAMSVTVTL